VKRRSLTVAAMLLVLTAAGCARQDERTRVDVADEAPDRGPVVVTGAEAVAPSDVPDESGRPGGAGAAGPAVPPPVVGGADARDASSTVEAAAGEEVGAAPDPAAVPLDPAVTATVQPLLVQMASDASIERQAAAEELDALHAAVMPYLTAALRGGTEAEKRGAAVFLIGRVPLDDDAVLAALIGALGADDAVLRHNALQAVEKLPEERLVRSFPALTALAKNAGEETAYRVRAVRAMAKLGAAAVAAMPDLFELARDDGVPELQRSACDAIAKVAPPHESEAFFLEVLRTGTDKDLRRLAAHRLVQEAMSPESVTGLIAAFGDAEADVRNAARDSIVAIGRPAVPQLIQALEEPQVQIRRQVVFTLGKLGALAADAAPALQTRLQDADPQVRALAAASLRIIQGP